MKEFKQTLYLRLSNRGVAVTQVVANHRFSVNLPSSLRGLGPCKITVQDAMVNSATLNSLTAVMEVFITSNIPITQSIDTETYAAGNFDGNAYNKLVTFQSDFKEQSFRLRPKAFLEFDVSSIPERIEWALFKRSGTGSTVDPINSANAYNFITLKIQVYNESCHC